MMDAGGGRPFPGPRCLCLCGVTCNSTEKLIAHAARLHKSHDKLWVCRICNKPFKLYRHLYLHQNGCYGFMKTDLCIRLEYKERVSRCFPLVEEHVVNGPGCGGELALAKETEESEITHGTIDIEDKIRSAVLQMTSELGGKYKVTEKAQDFMFKSLQAIEKLIRENSGVKRVPVPYNEFSSAYRRRKLMEREAGLVPPRQVIVGTRYLRKKGKLVRVNIKAYVVPLKESLAMILRNKFVLDAIVKSHRDGGHDDSSVIDISLGLSIDDVEFVVPIGQAKLKHKQTIATYHIMNLPAAWRSRDESKHLLFTCSSTVFNTREQADALLFADLKDIVKESEEGMSLLSGNEQLFRVKLVQLTADAEALASVLKMKRTGSRTTRPCWACDISSEDMKWTFDVGNVTLRTKQ